MVNLMDPKLMEIIAKADTPKEIIDAIAAEQLKDPSFLDGKPLTYVGRPEMYNNTENKNVK